MNVKIETSSALQDLVEIDKGDHKIRDLAKLFLEAMNDWPTFNQTNIQEFVAEAESYFGYPLTIDRISKKEFNGQNAWQLEAGSSLTELIETSTRFCNQSDFRTIVENILTFYSSTKNV